MKCSTCNKCNSCNYEGCYYCVDFVYTVDGYICTCEDGENCALKRIDDAK